MLHVSRYSGRYGHDAMSLDAGYPKNTVAEWGGFNGTVSFDSVFTMKKGSTLFFTKGKVKVRRYLFVCISFKAVAEL